VLGGSEIEAQRVCAALLGRGYRVTVLCAGGPPMPEVSHWIDPAGVPVHIFGSRWPARFRDYVFAVGVAWTLLRERPRYQLVYFLMQGLHLAAGLLIARLLSKPTVMKVSGSGLIPLMQESRLGRLELHWLQKWARRVMILNKGMAEEAIAAGFHPEQLLWMPNPVDTRDFAPCGREQRKELRARLIGLSQARIVVFIGRLAPEKELSSLIGGFAVAIRHAPQSLLVVVGDGPARQDSEDQVNRLNLAAQVRFTGRQTVREVREWLQVSDVFALVSSNEGFPCSLVEAMSVGLPSVVSNIPASTQLIDDGIHGLHVEVRNEAAIGEALSGLLADEAARSRMGIAARLRVVDNYSLDKVADRYEALFSDALRIS
jgi:glycosyltransferase involved in cell wall biosynthesis